MEAEGESIPKKKTKFDPEIVDPVFTTFDRDKISLDKCRIWASEITLVFLRVLYADANFCQHFAKATCHTRKLTWPEHPDREINCMVESLFIEGLDCLDKYFNEHKVPENSSRRIALAKLLNFFNKDHDSLYEDEDTEGEWAIRVAQHLLSQLAVHSTYVIDSANRGLSYESNCPCPQYDPLVGYAGDTSFGCRNGWHGDTDIIIDDIPVIVEEDINLKHICDTQSVNRTEIKKSKGLSEDCVTRLKAQTITSSPLQAKFNKLKLRSTLVPGIAISKTHVLVNFYDPEQDILLTTKVLQLIQEREMSHSVVILLWLTLNYRLFCSGLIEEMKRFKSGFLNLVDVDSFLKCIERPLHIKPPEDNQSEPKASLNPAYRFKPPPPTGTYIQLPIQK